MHKDFHHWCHTAHPKHGEAWLWGGADGIKIINLSTQKGGYGENKNPGKAIEANVNHSLRALKKIINKEKFESVALPKLATGVGGLDWEQVYPLIQSQLGVLDIPIYIYVVFHQGQKAKEAG
jgi:O-acetyl-ADP-ribose deacetylase (regulator of RNase III)